MANVEQRRSTPGAGIPARLGRAGIFPQSVVVEIRQHASLRLQIFLVSGAMCIGLCISGLALMSTGVGLGDLANEFVVSIVTNPQNISAVLAQAAPLLIVGLSAAIAFRVRFWNIGIEGQMIAGSIAATAVANADFGPSSIRIVVMMLAAALGGMAWVLMPAFLRIRLAINEIVSTLLLNYVAFNFMLYLLYGSWKDAKTGFPNSEQYDAVERLGLIGWRNLSYGLLLALGLAVLCWWLLNLSRLGYFVRVVQSNPRLAASVGLPVIGITLGAALASGALGGIAGFAVSAGVEYRMTQSFFIGYGFSGILIAFLARNNPLGAILVALFVATLFVASQSLQVFYQIPGSAVQLIQAIIVICIAASEFFVRYRIRFVE